VQIDPGSLSGGRSYYLMCSVVIPRPIAWVGTVNTDGSHNLAPFSFFNAFSATPALVVAFLSEAATLTARADPLRTTAIPV